MFNQTDGIEVLDDRKDKELVDSLMTFLSTRPGGQATVLRWDELQQIQSKLAHYAPETLRFYTHLCDDMGLLKNFVDDGEVFSLEGASYLGRLRRSQKRTLHRNSVGFWMAYFVLCFVLALGIAVLKGKGIVQLMCF